MAQSDQLEGIQWRYFCRFHEDAMDGRPWIYDPGGGGEGGHSVKGKLVHIYRGSIFGSRRIMERDMEPSNENMSRGN